MTLQDYSPLKIDALASTRAMPDDLIAAIPVLMVNRLGTTPTAYMKTENFLSHCEPGKNYRVSIDEGFVPSDEGPAPRPKPVQPPHLVLDGQWDEAINYTNDSSNILGGNGRYVHSSGKTEIVIPVAETTAEHLAYYGSWLVKSGNPVRFESTGNLPVTVTSVGHDYPQNYLLREELGGGAYLEVHDRPHFHMPLEHNNGGYLIIGKMGDDGIKRVSAFHIPYGYGIHMGPWVIHSDAYIIGRHLVIYSATPEFSTVILRDAENELTSIKFAT
ncbi:hypothetical protein [Lentibacter sp. XHP0401]|uniref:hypothetical protein n=1 Tax=Lentibacter sp. XHP0401 TaxID=2984334 RepID=UPI0021E79110|nr:hypothetical protein [Lentibacter sp. XHP0401]MCV2892715.1 hypothetical protein [Lentibacter sp. XHP0401]